MDFQVSVIIPALNEEQNIIKTLHNVEHALSRLSVRGEMIVVNDGSTDQTLVKVSQAQTQLPNLKVISHNFRQGIGKSFWDGVQEARGELVTMIPGDGENDAYEILRYLNLMDHVDIVVPFVFNKGKRLLIRRIISKLYRLSINLLFGTSLNYMNGTVLYRREILSGFRLRSSGFFYQTELLIRCLRTGYLYAEVPYGLNQREKGRSTALSLKSLKSLVIDLVLLKWEFLFVQPPVVQTGVVTGRRCAAFSVQT